MKYLELMIKTIVKIWFDDEGIYVQGDDGKTYRQSLWWYDRIRTASDAERGDYVISTIGIHWPKLDTDISFESFEYPDAEPTKLQRFFLTHPEINVAGFAKKFGYNASLLRSYINGFKTPSQAKEAELLKCIANLGREYITMYEDYTSDGVKDQQA